MKVDSRHSCPKCRAEGKKVKVVFVPQNDGSHKMLCGWCRADLKKRESGKEKE